MSKHDLQLCMRASQPYSHALKHSKALSASLVTCAAQDVTAVVDTCHEAGISKKCVKLRPIGVVKG